MKTNAEIEKEFDRVFVTENLWKSDDELTANVPIDNIKKFIFSTLDERMEWVRGMIEGRTTRFVKDWEKSLNIKQRFPFLTEEQERHILGEIRYQREQGGMEALQDVLNSITKGVTED